MSNQEKTSRTRAPRRPFAKRGGRVRPFADFEPAKEGRRRYVSPADAYESNGVPTPFEGREVEW